MKNTSKIILALDVEDISSARYFLNRLYPRVKNFKVGAQLFLACGPGIIQSINKKGGRVFLDLKLFDIPNTVVNAVRQAIRLKIAMLTLHISGGDRMLLAAVAAAREESRRRRLKRPLLLGVTVLTSQEADPRTVLAMARRGLRCGLDGVVCSAKEAAFLRSRIKKRFIIVTPGIRPKGMAAADQKRTATASEAIQAGSNYLVVGRPILKAADPLKAVEELF